LVKKFDDVYIRLDTARQCQGEMDRETGGQREMVLCMLAHTLTRDNKSVARRSPVLSTTKVMAN